MASAQFPLSPPRQIIPSLLAMLTSPLPVINTETLFIHEAWTGLQVGFCSSQLHSSFKKCSLTHCHASIPADQILCGFNSVAAALIWLTNDSRQ